MCEVLEWGSIWGVCYAWENVRFRGVSHRGGNGGARIWEEFLSVSGVVLFAFSVCVCSCASQRD